MKALEDGSFVYGFGYESLANGYESLANGCPIGKYKDTLSDVGKCDDGNMNICSDCCITHPCKNL